MSKTNKMNNTSTTSNDMWGLEEALAWVAWRDPQMVDKMANDRYSAVTTWNPPTYPPDDLITSLRNGEICAYGRKNGDGDLEAIDSIQWNILSFDTFFQRPPSARPIDGIGTFWTNLLFDAKTIQSVFPDPTKKPVDAYRTGLAGRPTSWQLIEEELRQRWCEEDLKKKTAQWAEELLNWLKSEHPNAARPKIKTLINKIPSVLRELRKNPKD